MRSLIIFLMLFSLISCKEKGFLFTRDSKKEEIMMIYEVGWMAGYLKGRDQCLRGVISETNGECIVVFNWNNVDSVKAVDSLIFYNLMFE